MDRAEGGEGAAAPAPVDGTAGGNGAQPTPPPATTVPPAGAATPGVDEAAGATGVQGGGEAAGPDGAGRRVVREELWLVLGLTFLASAAYALVDLVSGPLSGASVTLYRSSTDVAGLVNEVLSVGFSLVPVALVLHLLHRSGEGAATIGLVWRPPERLRRDVGLGLALFALVGSVGLGVYLGAVALGLNRDVAVITGDTTWWTGPVWVLRSIRFGVTEEVIVAGYMLHRLDQLGWHRDRALAASALLRASYHLYQGLGGFVGNLAMGVLFGRIYQRTGRTTPLVVAHVLTDVVAGLGYLALRDRVSWIPGP